MIWKKYFEHLQHKSISSKSSGSNRNSKDSGYSDTSKSVKFNQNSKSRHSEKMEVDRQMMRLAFQNQKRFEHF